MTGDIKYADYYERPQINAAQTAAVNIKFRVSLVDRSMSVDEPSEC